MLDDTDVFRIRVIAREEFNGGGNCKKGGELEMRINSLQSELSSEKADRKELDAEMFKKLDKVLMTIILSSFTLLIGLVVSAYLGRG